MCYDIMFLNCMIALLIPFNNCVRVRVGFIVLVFCDRERSGERFSFSVQFLVNA